MPASRCSRATIVPTFPFSIGLNPYRGCEHGCAYCFARPFHEYLGFSSGLDFETKIVVKLRAPELLSPRAHRPALAAAEHHDERGDRLLPASERQFRVTRGCLEVCAEFRNPVAVITKNSS